MLWVSLKTVSANDDVADAIKLVPYKVGKNGMA